MYRGLASQSVVCYFAILAVAPQYTCLTLPIQQNVIHEIAERMQPTCGTKHI
jgi:hypothetical protein